MKKAWRKRFAINDTRFLDLLRPLLLLLLLSEFLLNGAAAETEQKESDYSNNLGSEIRGGGMCASGKSRGSSAALCSAVSAGRGRGSGRGRSRRQRCRWTSGEVQARKGVGNPGQRDGNGRWMLLAGHAMSGRQCYMPLYVRACVCQMLRDDAML